MDAFPVFSFKDARDMRIGLMGGTFDPIHLGHLYAARQALTGAGLHRVVLLPSGIPPHKTAGTFASAADRLAMSALAVQSEEGLAVSDYEIAGGARFTADTLDGIRRLCGSGCSLSFILGADSLLDLRRWYRPDRLLALADIVAVYRPGYEIGALRAEVEYLRANFGARIALIVNEGVDISSSDIRERAGRGLPLSGLVPDAVAAYIREKGLYGNRQDR